MSTYDQWKASDPAGDEADVRVVRPEPDSDECPIGDVDWFCPACGAEIGEGGPHTPDCAAEPPKMVKCRACGADFPNPYGGGIESYLCDACINGEKK